MKGLTAAQVQAQIAAGKVNRRQQGPVKSLKQICAENIFTYFNLIFLVITILILIAGHYSLSDFLFIPVVVSNALVGIFQQWRSQKVLSRLTIISTPSATVIRDGQRQTVKVDELVVGDWLCLKAGEQISVDGKLRDGNLAVNESILTGEADEVHKQAGDSLYAGAYVVSGDGVAEVTKVGADTYAAQLEAQAKKTDRDDQGAMVRSIDRIVKVVGILIIPLGIAMVWQGMVVNHLSLQEAIAGMVAAVIGMIPQGLYLLVTVALATSAVRLARRKILLHNMHSIEQLSRVDTLCIDKTGTITEPEMQVTKLISLTDQPVDDLRAEVTDQVAQLSPDNDTMQALHRYFKPQAARQRAQRVIPFNSAYKYSGLVYTDHTAFIGAPENLLLGDYQRYADQVGQYQEQGYRVLLYGVLNQALADNQLPQPVQARGLIVLANPVRENAPQTFAYFKQQGVAIKVISGDNPQTVSAVAQAAGIAGAQEFVDARSLTTPALVQAAADHKTVFGRVTPDKKAELIEALQDQGHTVAMTGDGVNDILALKKADCSIAMASGSSAAMNAAAIVLLQSDFSAMPRIVGEGRRTVNNIQRSASLFLIKNIFSFLLALLTIYTTMSYPLRSSQVSLISAFMIGIPGYLLTLEADESPIKGHFIRTVMFNALPAALVDVFAVGLLMVVGNVFNIRAADISTVSALIMAFVGLAMLIYLARPFSWVRGLTIVVSAGGFIAAITLMGDFFRFVKPSPLVAALGLVFLLAAEAVLINFRWLVKWIAKGWQNHRQRKHAHGKHAS